MYIGKESLSHRFPLSKLQSINSNVLVVFLIIFIITSACDSQSSDSSTTKDHWVGTWNTAPQLVEPHNMPPAPGLTNNTIRQIVCVSLGGDSIRLRFSNEFSTSPVTMKSVHIAVSKGKSAIDSSTDKVVKFDGKAEVTIEAGKPISSDPFKFSIQPRTQLAITIYFGDTAPDVTGHPGSRTTSYIVSGNAVSETEFSKAVKTDHWYIINGIDVIAPKTAAAVVIIGNSITDGRGSGTNKQNRWPDELAKRLLENPETQNIAVLNQGIGGNCVLKQCLGPSALDRFQRDVIQQSGVRWLIILEGINDIGGSRGTDDALRVAGDLIAAYDRMIDSAKALGINVYGATLLPFGGSFYDSPDHEMARSKVNEWIRTSGRFDEVIDFEAALADPDNPLNLLPAADTGDHLHPNETGHRMMAEAVDLMLFK